jgi:hypothetical protein
VPPLLLVHGWLETWYAWRMVMPTPARDADGANGHGQGFGPGGAAGVEVVGRRLQVRGVQRDQLGHRAVTGDARGALQGGDRSLPQMPQ